MDTIVVSKSYDRSKSRIRCQHSEIFLLIEIYQHFAFLDEKADAILSD